MTHLLLALLLAVSLVAGPQSCRDGDEAVREEFVQRFVRSAFEDSALHRRYVSESDRKLIEAARPRMTGQFEIIQRDAYGAGSYEYGVRFSNGATAVVAVYEQDGEVATVTLAINDQPQK